MGVTYVSQWKQREGQNIQQGIEELQNVVERIGAKKSGLFLVECESFHHAANPAARTLHMLYDTEYPASRFAYFEEGSFLVTDVMLPSFLSKLRNIWQPKKGGKIECKGQRYQLHDFFIKIGTVSVGPNTRGIAIELEYAACVYARDCWGIMSEMLQRILGDQAPPTLPANMAPKAAERFSAESIVLQYIEVFNNLRKANVL